MLAPILTFFRTNPMPDTVFREITGNNIPHVLIVRNKDELIDQSLSQFGNTAGYFGTGLLLDKLLNVIPKNARWRHSPGAMNWFYLGKSLAIFSLTASTSLAIPFLRNYITTKRTKTATYAEMIGEKANTNRSQAKLDTQTTYDKSRFFKTLGVGGLLSGGFLASTLALIHSGVAFPKWLAKFPPGWQKVTQKLQMGGGLATTFGLKNGAFKNFTPLATVAFWVIPIYSGMLAAARDKYEVKELLLRFAAFNLAFFVFPITIEKGIEHLTRNFPKTKLLGPPKNIAYLGKFFSSLVFCSAIPTVVNIYLTRQRIKRDEAKLGQQGYPAPPRMSPALVGTLRQKSFYEFSHLPEPALSARF